MKKYVNIEQHASQRDNPFRANTSVLERRDGVGT